MSSLNKHLGFLLHIDEIRFKGWLNSNAQNFLREIGVKEGQTVLDVGSGSGTFTIPSATLVGKNGMVYALDVNKKALSELKMKAEKLRLVNIRILNVSANEKLKLENKSIDHVLLIDVLQEVTNRDSLFSEVVRVLRDAGTVTIFPMHINYDEIIKLAESTGLKLKERKYNDQLLIFKQ